jgi:hypothetical protein
VVPYVAVDDKVDASKPGREQRADYLAKVRAGKPVNLKGLAPVRSEATIADVTDPFCDAPFAVLYVMGCGKPPECPRLTMSVRDTYGATSTTVVDSVVDSSGKWLPCNFEKLMEVVMTLATSATSAGVRGNVGDDVYRVLSKWLQDPTSVINISVNGAPPQLVLEAGAVIGDPRLARDGIATLDVDVLVPTLPAPGGRTPAQKFWLEPEVPCLLAACVAALEAGESHPSKSWKKLRPGGEVRLQIRQVRGARAHAPDRAGAVLAAKRLGRDQPVSTERRDPGGYESGSFTQLLAGSSPVPGRSLPGPRRARAQGRNAHARGEAPLALDSR